MGWDFYRATHYADGKVDRKAECDEYFNEGSKGQYKVAKSVMVGSTYYAAVKELKKLVNGAWVDVPEDKAYVFGVVVLTQTKSNDYFNFGMKPIHEASGPCKSECPMNIIKMLSPTDDKYALEWRRECMEYRKKLTEAVKARREAKERSTRRLQEISSCVK